MVLFREKMQKPKVVMIREMNRFVGRTVRIAGLLVTGKVVQPEFTWSDLETWSVSLDLAMGPNVFELKAYDYQGDEIGSDTITVTRN